jgi:hypothetical protein
MKYSTMQEIVESWEDVSWGNDECPSYLLMGMSGTLDSLKLFVDEDYRDHDDPEYFMYQLHRVDDDGECEYPRLYACNSADEMVDQINAQLRSES